MTTARTQEPDAILTLDEAAELLKVSVRTIRTWMHLRSLPYKKCGQTVRFSRAAVLKWMEK